MSDYSLTANNNIVVRNSDQVYIPNDPNNVDWQRYEAWLFAGNTPDPYVPPPPSAQQQYGNAIAAGLSITFSVSTGLSSTYAIDPQTQFNLCAEIVSILTNGTFGTGQLTRPWPDMAGQYRMFTIEQFKVFASAINFYVNQLYAVVATLQAGQQTNWPNNAVTIDV